MHQHSQSEKFITKRDILKAARSFNQQKINSEEKGSGRLQRSPSQIHVIFSVWNFVEGSMKGRLQSKEC